MNVINQISKTDTAIEIKAFNKIYVESESFHPAEAEILNRQKRQPMKQEAIFANYSSEEGLLSRTC